MNTAAQHLTSCLAHLALAQTSAALACAELAGKPRTTQATDALNDILEAARSIRVLRDGLAVDVTPPKEVSAMPGRGDSPIHADPLTAAAPATGVGTYCACCGEVIPGFRGPDAFCETHMPEDD